MPRGRVSARSLYRVLVLSVLALLAVIATAEARVDDATCMRVDAPDAHRARAVTCDGTATIADGTDAARVLQAAIQGAGDGGTVLVTRGEYALARPVRVPFDDFAFVGVDAPRLVMPARGDGLLQVRSDAGVVDGVTVTGLVLRHDRGTSGDAVQVHTARNVTVADVTIEEALEEGIVVYFSENVTLRGNTVLRAGNRAAAANPAIQLYGTSASRVIGNHVDQSGVPADVGIEVHGGMAPATGNVIAHNVVTHAGRFGVHLVFETAGTVVENNHVIASGEDGIHVRAGGRDASGTRVTGNAIVGPGADGVRVLADGIEVSGNVVRSRQ